MLITWWHYLIVFAVAFIVTVAAVPLVRRIAISHGIVDQPSARRVNKEPIPRLGGVAMYLGLLTALVVEYVCELAGFWPGPFSLFMGSGVNMVGVTVGLSIVVVVGVVDDVQSLRPGVKFLGQIVAAVVIASSGVLMSGFKMPLSDGHIVLGWLSYPITVIYLVAFANIINLIDGLDGLAAGITGISALGLFALTVTLVRNDASIVAIALIAVCVAFLFYNFHPASIFMGDSGSLLLGMTLGAISLMGATRFSSITALAVPILIAGVPVIDTASAILRRLLNHQPIQQADRGHLHHRLLDQGFSQRKAVLIIYAWTAVLTLGGIFVWNMGGLVKYTVLFALLAASAFIVFKLQLLGPVLEHHYFPDIFRRPRGKATPVQAEQPAGQPDRPADPLAAGDDDDPLAAAIANAQVGELVCSIDGGHPDALGVREDRDEQ